MKSASTTAPTKGSRWYPSADQLRDPQAVEHSFRQLLDQHYRLQDAHSALLARVNSLPSQESPSEGPPPGSGPSDSMLLGLRVAPIDTNTLADGTKLTFVKSQGHLEFK
jgi:hypothetical protein